MDRFAVHLQAWWDALMHPEKAGQLVLERDARRGFARFLVGLIAVLYAIYGFSMGIFHGFWPGVVSGLKLPFLYIFTLLACFPAFYVLNCLKGPRLNPAQCLRLILLAISANAAALASYTLFSFFFTFTTSRQGYSFLVLMHVIVFAAAGLASVAVIGLVFRGTAARLGYRWRPLFIAAWGMLYAFVGTQMSWVLRPWIGSWTGPYTPLRPLGGSFIEALWHLLQRF